MGSAVYGIGTLARQRCGCTRHDGHSKGDHVKQFLAGLEAIVTLALVVVAIAGITYHTFRDGGLLSQGLGKISDAYINHPLMALAATVAFFFSYRAWHQRKVSGKDTKLFDYFVYVLMALGIYFIGHFTIKGEF